METFVVVCSTVSLVAFTVAAFIAFRAGVGKRGEYHLAYLMLGVAMSLYIFVALSNLLEHAHVTAYLDEFEDYAEIAFAPLLLMAAYAGESERRAAENRRSSLMLQRQNDMLMNIVDTSPGGILIVGPGGHVTFANEAARNMLGITEDPDTGMLTTPAWTIATADGTATDLARIVEQPSARGQRVILTMPSGSRLELLFSVTTMSDASRSLGGAVVAVEQASAH